MTRIALLVPVVIQVRRMGGNCRAGIASGRDTGIDELPAKAPINSKVTKAVLNRDCDLVSVPQVY